MNTFEDFELSKQLNYAIADLKFEKPTPIQVEAFSVILSGKDVVGISQTGTGKTFAYMLPLLHQHKFSNQVNPKILIMVPTRELVEQLMEQIKSYSAYINLRVVGIYGESSMSVQQQLLAQGQDIVVATPGRLYDLILARAVSLKEIKKLVIDEVDVMLDLGFRLQLTNIFDLLPERRQNIMFSATMTEEVDILIDDFFRETEKISIAVSGTPLENIQQTSYQVQNFHTKINLLVHLLRNREELQKVLVFIANKKLADKVFDKVSETFSSTVGIIHSNKAQNARLRAVDEFEQGKNRVLIATDVIARGLDLEKITHVINFDVPVYPENYIHRIGRTGRAEENGQSILFFTEKEKEFKTELEEMMDYSIPEIDFPEEVEINPELIPEERSKPAESNFNRNFKRKIPKFVPAEKKEKNQKVNLGGSYKRKLAEKYKKSQRRGDKQFSKKKK